MNEIEKLSPDFSFGVLRRLELEDTQGMLEWMHDASIASVFLNDFSSSTESSIKTFIESSWSDTENLHFAITQNGDYMGTISLKAIDTTNNSAEYAISTRKGAHGTGIAKRATLDILEYAFRILGLHRVYLNVRESNERAIAFYRKMGFSLEGIERDALLASNGEYESLLWFSMLSNDAQDCSN